MPRNASMTHEDKEYTYLSFHLTTKALEDECRLHLEEMGIECVQDGGPYQAYGIVEASTDYAGFEACHEAIRSVAIGAPPSGF